MANITTFAMIKPDAVKDKLVEAIIYKIEEAGFSIQALKMTQLTLPNAAAFYEVHKECSFYEQMYTFIASGPVVALVLAKTNAVVDFGQLKECLRRKWASSRTHNAIHGADATAAQEIAFFFPEMST
ncbi:MAG: nucleoside-diphosphate kinase [Roseivirga sp.]